MRFIMALCSYKVWRFQRRSARSHALSVSNNGAKLLSVQIAYLFSQSPVCPLKVSVAEHAEPVAQRYTFHKERPNCSVLGQRDAGEGGRNVSEKRGERLTPSPPSPSLPSARSFNNPKLSATFCTASLRATPVPAALLRLPLQASSVFADKLVIHRVHASGRDPPFGRAHRPAHPPVPRHRSPRQARRAPRRVAPRAPPQDARGRCALRWPRRRKATTRVPQTFSSSRMLPGHA